MQLDPHAIQIRTDGSCLQKLKYRAGCAAIVYYPETIGKDPEQIIDFGCPESTNQRMELKACLLVLRWIREHAPWPGITRVQIITDSTYVKDNITRSASWRRNGWRNRHGEPMQNVDLWKEFLSIYPAKMVTVTIQQTKGKKDKYLREIDGAARAAATRGGADIDRGYQKGKIVRSALPGVASRLNAEGQELFIRPYSKKVMGRASGENRVKFDVFSNEEQTYIAKFYAFATPQLAFDLHCHHGYRVVCNSDPNYPQIVSLVEEVPVPKVSRKK